jgi:hypothetical protein
MVLPFFVQISTRKREGSINYGCVDKVGERERSTHQPLRHDVAREMRVGPSKSACRS